MNGGMRGDEEMKRGEDEPRDAAEEDGGEMKREMRRKR